MKERVAREEETAGGAGGQRGGDGCMSGWPGRRRRLDERVDGWVIGWPGSRRRLEERVAEDGWTAGYGYEKYTNSKPTAKSLTANLCRSFSISIRIKVDNVDPAPRFSAAPV